jgi:hypothetical protein
MIIEDPSRDCLPGDIGFAFISGKVGFWVGVGQALLDDDCIFAHAYIIVRDPDDPTRMGAVEAMPGGAEYVPPDVLATRITNANGYARLPLTEEQREEISAESLALIGVPYSFLDYLSLALVEWKVPGYRLVAGFVASTDHMICSQLVTHALTRVGYFLFTTDQLLPQQVTPGALWWQAGSASKIDRPFWLPQFGTSYNARLM